METVKDTIGQRGISYGLASAGVGYICIPRNYDRDTYIKNCLANQTVCVRTENFEFLTDVYIDKVVLQNIIFPKSRNENGSLVVWVTVAKHGVPVVIGTLSLKNNGQETLQENSFCLIRKDNKGNVVSLVGEPTKGLDINIVNENENNGIDINILNKFSQAALNFYVQGTVNLEIETDVNLTVGNSINLLVKDASVNNLQTSISYKFGNGLEIKDEFNNYIKIDTNGVQLTVPSTKKIKIGNGENNEPAVLGNELNNSLTKLVDCFNAINDAVNAAQKASIGTPSAAAFTALQAGMVVMSTNLEIFKELIKLNNSQTVEVSP